MAFSFKSFAVMLAEKFDDLPDIFFAETSELGKIYQYIIEHIQIGTVEDMDLEDLVFMITSQIEALMADPKHIDELVKLDRAANLLTKEVSGAFQVLRYNVADLVGSLLDEVLKANDKELIAQGAEVLINDDTKPATDFGVINWGSLGQYNYINEVIEVCSGIAKLNNREISNININYLKNRIPLMGFVSIDLNDENFEMITDQLNKAISAYNIDDIKDAFRAFITPVRYTGFANNIKKKSVQINADDYSWLFERVKIMKAIIKALDLLSIDLSEQTLSNLNNNKKLVHKLCYVAEFYLIFVKDKLKDSLILSKQLVNGDNLTKFENAGGTKFDISYHIRAFFEDRTIPMMGVPLNTVVEFREKVDAIITSKNDQVKMKMKMFKTKAMNKAFFNTLTSYLRSLTKEVIPEQYTVETFYGEKFPMIDRILNNFQYQTDNVEDALYKFVLHVWYDNTIIQTLYNYLGREYVKIAASSSENQEQDLVIADAYVVATLIGEYFTKRHLNL